ncbi:hypothetical protein P4E94_00780 [Pontiellaceae bacterium B12219]|nr:hypothetical protein [Pontiellaceae bacterium B12219]
MKPITIYLYSLLWIIYVIFTVVAFPQLRISCAIPVFFLLSLGSWLFGRTVGLLLILISITHLSLLTSFIYPDVLVFYEYKFTGYLLLIAVAFLTGSLRDQYLNIKKTNLRLDQLVLERNRELSELTEKLLENYETIKIKQAQLLHDGIGQQLTGIQLISASLADQLLQEKNPIASNAHHLQNQTIKLHNHLRKISRLLFPVRMEQVGLVSAINELSSCLQDVKPVKSVTSETKKLPQVPVPLMLQTYRICQESALYSIDSLKADQVCLAVCGDEARITISVTHNGNFPDATLRNASFNLIQHRLRMLRGKLRILPETTSTRTVQFIIPVQPTDPE